MNIVVCVDDNLGMAFHGRRQSRDRRVIEDLCLWLDGRQLLIRPGAGKLFPEDCSNIHICEAPLEVADENDWCFVETEDLLPHITRIDSLLLYRWGREYPCNLSLPESLLTERRLMERIKFAGSSHEHICREVYER